MLSTSSVHSTVSLPPCLPSTGAPTLLERSEPEPLLPPPQPARTAPARASARNALLATRCMRFLPPAAPAGSSTVHTDRRHAGDDGDDDRYGRREGMLTREASTDELELRAARLVARRDVAQDLEHRLRGGRAVAVLERGRVDLPDRRLAPEIAHDDVVADAREPQLGDQRDADAGRHEALHRRVVVGLERDPRLVAGRRARPRDQPVALAVRLTADPRLARQVGQPNAPTGRQRVVARQHEEH